MINYIYNQLDRSERSYVIDSITRKYLGEYVNELDLNNSKISDNDNNLILVDDFLMGLKISYLCSSESDWYEAIISEMNERKEKYEEHIKTSERRFLDKI